MSKSYLEELFHKQLQALEIPEAKREYRFCVHRRWKFDFAWPEKMFAIEIEGGVFLRGRHQRPNGFLSDMIKYNTAMLTGWRVLRGNANMVKNGELSRIAEQVLTENNKQCVE